MASLEAKAIAALVVIALIVVGLLAFGHHERAAERTANEAKTATVRAEAAEAIVAQQERARATEHQLTQAREEIVDVQNATKLHDAATAAAFRADADGMRQQIRAALASSGRASDSLESCQRRAATAGDLLVDGLRLQITLAAGAEHHAADVRAVHAFDKVKAAASTASSAGP